MAEREVSISLKVQDEASEGFAKIQKLAEGLVAELERLKALGADRTVGQEFLLGIADGMGLVGKSTDDVAIKIDQLQKGLGSNAKGTEEATEKTKDFEKSQKSLGQTVTELVGTLALLTGGAVSLGSFWNTAIQGAADYELALTRLNIAAGDLNITQNELAGSVGAFADQFGVGLQEVTAGFQTIVQFGAKSTAEIEAVATASQNLADITGQGLAPSIQLVSKTLTAYNLGFDKAEEVTDGLLTTSQQARIPFQQLANSLGFLIPQAETVGVSLEELEASMITLARSGTPPTRVMRELAGILNQLQQPGGKAAEIFQRAGFESGQAAVKALGFQGALKLVADAAKESGEQIPGITNSARTMAAVLELSGKKGAGLNKALDDLAAKKGKVKEAADTINKSFGDAFNDLADNTKNAFVQIGIATQTFLRPLIDGLNAVFVAIRQFSEAHPVIVQTVALLAGFATIALTISALVVSFGSLASIFGGPLVKAVALLTTSFSTFNGVLLATKANLTGVIQAIKGVSLGAVVMGAALGGAALFYTTMANKVEEANKALDEHIERQKEIDKLREAEKESGANEVRLQGAQELATMTAAQIEKERALVQQLILRAEVEEKQLRTQKGFESTHARAAERLEELKAANETYGEALLEAKQKEKDQQEELVRTTLAYNLTKEAVDTYASAVKQIDTENLEAVTEELNRQEEAAIQAAGDNQERVQDVQDHFAEARITAATKTTQKLIQIESERVEQQKAIIERTVTDERERNQQIFQLDVKLRQDQIKNLDTLSKAIQAERAKAVSAYEKYADRVKALDKEIAGLKRSAINEVADEQRASLTPQQKLADIQEERDNNRVAIQLAIENKDFELARETAARQADLFKQEQAASKEAGVQFDFAEKRGELLQEQVGVREAEKAVAQQAAAEQLILAQELDARLANIKTVVTDLQGQVLSLVDVNNINAAHEAFKLLHADKSTLEDPIKLTPDMTALQAAVAAFSNTPIPVTLVPTLGGGAQVTPNFGAEGPGGVLPAFAHGGVVTGGTPGKDSVLAAVMPGEAITRTPAVNYYGQDFFRALNRMSIPRASLSAMFSRLPKFAAGGIVGGAGRGSMSRVSATLNFPFGSFPMETDGGTMASLTNAIRIAALKRRV